MMDAEKVLGNPAVKAMVDAEKALTNPAVKAMVDAEKALTNPAVKAIAAASAGVDLGRTKEAGFVSTLAETLGKTKEAGFAGTLAETLGKTKEAGFAGTLAETLGNLGLDSPDTKSLEAKLGLGPDTKSLEAKLGLGPDTKSLEAKLGLRDSVKLAAPRIFSDGLKSASPMGHERATSTGRAASETLTLRLSPVDRALLDRLVELRAEELADEGLEATAVSVVRGLIRREAKAKGLL
jgi:hypothetical protein